MKWQEYKPNIGAKTVLTYKERYNCCTPYFGVPNLFHAIKNKVNGFDRLIEYINTAAKVEFTYEKRRPVIEFTPNISKRYKAPQYKSERRWTYDYISRMLQILGLKVDDALSTTEPPVVRVALDDKSNLSKMRHLARYFSFDNLHMLTRERVKELKQKIK